MVFIKLLFGSIACSGGIYGIEARHVIELVPREDENGTNRRTTGTLRMIRFRAQRVKERNLQGKRRESLRPFPARLFLDVKAHGDTR